MICNQVNFQVLFQYIDPKLDFSEFRITRKALARGLTSQWGRNMQACQDRRLGLVSQDRDVRVMV